MDPRPNAPAAPIEWNQAERSYLDFVQALLTRPTQELRPVSADLFKQAAAAFEAEHAHAPATREEVASLMDGEAPVQYMRFFRRKAQDMKWVGLEALMDPQEKALDAWLDERSESTGKVELDPDLEVPGYFFTGFHHQPGGYSGQPLSGLMYDVGLDVSFSGLNFGGVADDVPDRPYGRIIDLGCGSGRSTELFATRFPSAEIWGVDPSGPLVKLAHKRAEQKDIRVNYRQAMAEDTRFPDGHFDLAACTILFHEVPDDAALHILEEAHRILAPGGIFAIADLLPYSETSPFDEWFIEWQVVHNNEPFFGDAFARDLTAMAREAGFSSAEAKVFGGERANSSRQRPGLPYLVMATK